MGGISIGEQIKLGIGPAVTQPVMGHRAGCVLLRIKAHPGLGHGPGDGKNRPATERSMTHGSGRACEVGMRRPVWRVRLREACRVATSAMEQTAAGPEGLGCGSAPNAEDYSAPWPQSYRGAPWAAPGMRIRQAWKTRHARTEGRRVPLAATRDHPGRIEGESPGSHLRPQGMRIMGPWQPITTAPRDGRTVLAYLPANAGLLTRQDVVAIFWDKGSGWATAYSGASLDAEPTYWMPLPDPPRVAAQHRKQDDRDERTAPCVEAEPVSEPDALH